MPKERNKKKELDIAVSPKDAILVHTMYRTKHDETGDRVDLFFEVTKWSGEVTNQEPHKCDDIRWFPVSALPENMMHHVKHAIQNIEREVQPRKLYL